MPGRALSNISFSDYTVDMGIKEDTRSAVETYLAPAGEQAELVAEFSEVIKGFHDTPILRGADGTEVPIPEELFEILTRAAAELQRGRGITIIPNDKLLTTQEAADILGVSRPTLVKMLETGALPFGKAGRHRRILLGDLLDFQRREEKERLTTLREIASQTPTAETFYDPSKSTRSQG